MSYSTPSPSSRMARSIRSRGNPWLCIRFLCPPPDGVLLHSVADGGISAAQSIGDCGLSWFIRSSLKFPSQSELSLSCLKCQSDKNTVTGYSWTWSQAKSTQLDVSIISQYICFPGSRHLEQGVIQVISRLATLRPLSIETMKSLNMFQSQLLQHLS